MDMAYCAKSKNFFLHKTEAPRAYNKVLPVNETLVAEKVNFAFIKDFSMKIKFEKCKAFQ